MTTSLNARSIAFTIGALLAIAALPAAQAQQTADASRAADLVVPTTKVLAIGKFAAEATPGAWRPYLDAEVRQTVELYLGGKIEQWWVKPDQTGVVFLFSSDNAKDAQLDSLRRMVQWFDRYLKGTPAR